MKHLSTVARIITPLAMVVFLAYEINRSMAVDGYWAVALLIGAIGTAVGIEIVGILAGHALEGFYYLGDKNRATLSFVLLIAYTVTAVYILRKNEAMVLVPIIAAIVYLLASLTTNLETTIDNRKGDEAEIKAFNREQAKADRDLERELKRQKQADETAVKLARVSAKQTSSQPVRRQPADEPAKHYECVCGRVFDGSRSYNAHRRHCEIPASEPARIYENGYHK